MWRFQDWGDNNHFAIGTQFTADIFRKDATVHNGPRLDWGKDWADTTDDISRCNDWVVKAEAETCGTYPPGGDGFLQFGSWRMGNVDGAHFTLSHKLGGGSISFRSDGAVINGVGQPHNLWTRAYADSATNIVIGDRYIEFAGLWRLTVFDRHISISH